MKKSIFLFFLFPFILSACTSKEAMLPTNGQTMQQLFEAHMGSATERDFYQARETLRRPLTETEKLSSASANDARSTLQQQFKRIPNPDLVMFVRHHVSADGTPVPDYVTVFPMYEHVEYALSGEAN